MKLKKWVMVKHFEGFPKDSDFELVEEDIPELQDGDVLFQATHLSVDPYMRPYMAHFPEGTTMIGQQLGKVVATKNDQFPIGKMCLVTGGWVSHYLYNPTKQGKVEDQRPPPVIPIPDISPLPISYLLGCLGMPGCTAYFGLLELCKPKAGETVVVNAAAGAVGSVVGQIAKIKGCNVVGFAGTDDKCAWLKELGFDHAYNYKTCDLDKVLKEGAPKGVDCYFDNVGGDFTSTVISNHMNLFGRIAVCGSISAYNATELPTGPYPFGTFIGKQLRMEGFIVYRWVKEMPAAITEMAKWMQEGKLKHQEHITKGFENMPKAFFGLLRGENTGKAIVET